MNTDGFSVQQFFGVLRRRGWIVLQAVVILAAVAVLAAVRGASEFEASATLLIDGSKPPLAGLAAVDNELTADTAARLVRTREVARRVREALGSDLTVDTLLARVSTEVDGPGAFVSVSARGGSGAEAALIANSFASQFVALRAETPYVGLRKAVQAIQRQLRSASGTERQALLAQLTQLETLAAVPTADVELADPAVAPTHPVEPQLIRDGIVGAALGLLLGLVLVLALEALDPRVKAFAELRRIVPAPQLAGVPAELFRRPGILRRRARAEPRVAFAARRYPEAFERLRTSLLVFNADDDLNSILVTSAHDEREGKTTVAANLAVSLAKVGLRVCAVDVDLRHPRLARHFGLHERDPGVSDVVEGVASLRTVVQRFAVPGAPLFLNGNGRGDVRAAEIAILPAGRATASPAELIASQALHELLDELERTFDVVVVDCAPILAASDGLPLIARASGTLLVARLFHTPRASVVRAAEIVVGARGRLLGVVGTGVPPRELREEGYGPWPVADAHAAPSRVAS